eukprot:UN20329
MLKSYREWSSRNVFAHPNQWMLVIKDGKLRNAAIGLNHFRGFNETIVTYPSKMQTVNFVAEQVTKQMQGIQLKGFTSWVVYREDDGPYRAYEKFDGLTEQGQKMANKQIGNLVESVLRQP